jgi:WD40 repeat protein
MITWLLTVTSALMLATAVFAAQALPSSCQPITGSNVNQLAPVAEITLDGIDGVIWPTDSSVIGLDGYDDFILLNASDLTEFNRISPEDFLFGTSFRPGHTEIALVSDSVQLIDYTTNEVHVLAAQTDAPFDYFAGAVFNSDGSRLAVYQAVSIGAGAESTPLQIFDAQTGEVLSDIDLPIDFYDFYFVGEDQIIAFGFENIYLIDLNSESVVAQSAMPASFLVVGTVANPVQNKVVYIATDYTVLQTHLAAIVTSTLEQIGPIRSFSYNMTDPYDNFELFNNTARRAAISAGGDILAVTNGPAAELWRLGEDGSVTSRTWRVLDGQASNVLDVSFSPNGLFLTTLVRPNLDREYRGYAPATITFWGVCA